MDQKDYLKLSERTEKKFPDGFTMTSDQQVIMNYLADDLSEINQALDHMKKHMIYGAECVIQPTNSDYEIRRKRLSPIQMELLHAAMGKVTEAIEFYEAVYDHVAKDKELDVPNLFEEIGDGHWYDALALRLMGKTFNEAWSTNILKLAERYGDKFSEDAALVRDLKSERKILEEGASQ